MIYFIGNKDFDICKIGYSKNKNVKSRVRNLQTACPFELEFINSIEGDAKEEMRLHYHFKNHRLKGEWFKLSKINPFICLQEVSEIPILEKELKVKGEECVKLGKNGKILKRRQNIMIGKAIKKDGKELAKRLSKPNASVSLSMLLETGLEIVLDKHKTK